MPKEVSRHISDRYPGWVFEKTVITRSDGTVREEWFGTKKGVGYAVSGAMHKGEVWGELLTRQQHFGSIAWEPIRESRNPYEGKMSECIQEAERRAAYWASRGEKDVYGEYLKLA